MIINYDFTLRLNKLGYNVVFINDSYWVFNSFIPADNLVVYHEVNGKRIDLLEKSYAGMSDSAIITMIDNNYPKQRVQFHNSIQYAAFYNAI